MASFIYLSAIEDVVRGAIDFDTDAFKVMLCTSAYTPNQTTHTKRSDISGEVAAGAGYTAGGNSAAISAITKDTGNLRLDITLGGTTWPTSSITARYAIYYKSRGGAASADELVACNDFGSNITSTSATFTLNSSLVRFQL